MKEKLSLVGVLIIIAGVAFATARLAWSPKADQASQKGNIEQVVAQEGASEPANTQPQTLVRCVVGSSEYGQEKIAWYPVSEGCPREEEASEFAGGEGSVAGEKVTTSLDSEKTVPEQTSVPEAIVDLPEVDSQETIAVSQDIRVETPASGQALSSPFTVQGTSKLEVVHIHVTSKTGIVLIHEHAQVRFMKGQEWGGFKWNIAYEFSGTKEGYVLVLPEDDDPSKGVKVPVTF